jgi:hypothetical protein
LDAFLLVFINEEPFLRQRKFISLAAKVKDSAESVRHVATLISTVRATVHKQLVKIFFAMAQKCSICLLI